MPPLLGVSDVKRKVQVFVSHSQSDAGLAHRIASDLESVQIRIWIAPESIHPGEGWVDAISRGFEESTHVVVILTPRSVESMWVRQEVSTAIALERKGKIQLIPVDVEPCELPPLWEAYQKISLQRDYALGVGQLREVLVGKRRHKAPRRVTPFGAAVSSHLGVNKADLSEVDAYARLYDALYPRLPGDQRNYVLNAVLVDQLYQLGGATKFPPALFARLFARGSDGDRLVALVLLQTAPSTTCLNIALEAIQNPRSPFEQYHGLRAVDLMTHQLGKSQVAKLTRALDLARSKYLIPANRSRWDVYEDISAKLLGNRSTRIGKRPTTRSTGRAKATARRST
jgi:hypothetical protein